MLQAAERSDRFLSSDQIDSLITALRTRFEDGLRSASSDEITDFGAHWKLLRRGFPAQSCRDVILRAAE